MLYAFLVSKHHLCFEKRLEWHWLTCKGLQPPEVKTGFYFHLEQSAGVGDVGHKEACEGEDPEAAEGSAWAQALSVRALALIRRRLLPSD